MSRDRPPLQNLVWSVLARNRLRPISLTGDLKQAFLQIRIRQPDRDVLRFHWIKDRETLEVEVLRFTRALFGLGQSSFILGGRLIILQISTKRSIQNWLKKSTEISM